MSDPITLSGTIPGLLCPGMLATGRVDAGSWVTGRIVAVDMAGERAKYPSAPRCSVGIADQYGMRPFRPEEVEIDLSDLLTLQATVAWCASKASGRAVGPHNCTAHISDGPPGGRRRVPVRYYDSAMGSVGYLSFPVDYTAETGIRALALAMRSIALAIHDGRYPV